MTTSMVARGGIDLGGTKIQTVVVDGGWKVLGEARRSPFGTLILLNGLNVVDAIMSDAAIGAGVARELNPLILAVGAPVKLALVAALSLLLCWKRPQALVVPGGVFVVLIAYHLTGLLGTF